MSITKGFEKRRAFPVADGPAMFYWDDVGHLLRHARELETMLKKHEWDYHSDWSVWTCPECGGDKEDIGVLGQLVGHSPDCALAKLLEGTSQ